MDLKTFKTTYLLKELYEKMFQSKITNNGNISCPFKDHEDSTPSFSFCIGKNTIQKFNCFGCKRSGDIFDFIGYYFDIPGPENLFKQIEKLT